MYACNIPKVWSHGAIDDDHVLKKILFLRLKQVKYQIPGQGKVARELKDVRAKEDDAAAEAAFAAKTVEVAGNVS